MHRSRPDLEPVVAAATAFSHNGHEPPSPPADLSLDEFERLVTVPESAAEVVEDVLDVSDTPILAGPPRTGYFRVWPGVSWIGRFLQIGRNLHLCYNVIEHPDVRDHRVHVLRTHDGELRLWAIPLPKAGEDHPTAAQRRKIVAVATEDWAAARWDIGKKKYVCQRYSPTDITAAPLPEPVWPTVSLQTLVLQACGSTIIRTLDDPRLVYLCRFERDELSS
jgi:hypothetical protein